MEYEYGYHAFHLLHFFLGIFLVLLGVFIGKALAWRRMMWRFGPACGHAAMAGAACCGPRRGCGQAPAAGNSGEAPEPAPQAPKAP